MSPSTRIPSHLQPYVRPPRDDSLLLLTSTLGATANWLIIRFLCDALSNNGEADGVAQGSNIVLVSWMREYEFWKQEARKGGGLDLERLRRDGRFAFVDGLSELCLDASNAPPSAERRLPQSTTASAGQGSLPQRAPQILPVRGHPGRIVPARAPPPAATSPATAPATPTQPTPGLYTLPSLDLASLRTTLTTAVSSLSSSSPQRKTVLILDNPDLLLALDPTLKPAALSFLILTLHAHPSVSHILTHMQADNPLLGQSSPLEVAHHNFLVKMAHVSRRIMGVRVLDTGVARDVSGVVRVTEQKVGWVGLGFEGDEIGGDGEEGKGREFLYQVKGDGSVRVFERGAGGEG